MSNSTSMALFPIPTSELSIVSITMELKVLPIRRREFLPLRGYLMLGIKIGRATNYLHVFLDISGEIARDEVMGSNPVRACSNLNFSGFHFVAA